MLLLPPLTLEINVLERQVLPNAAADVKHSMPGRATAPGRGSRGLLSLADWEGSDDLDADRVTGVVIPIGARRRLVRP